jgi:glucose-1-phosphate thymidylyltransferase
MPQSLLQMSTYVEITESRQGLLIASPEEVAFRLGYISSQELQILIEQMPVCPYRHYLEKFTRPA